MEENHPKTEDANTNDTEEVLKPDPGEDKPSSPMAEAVGTGAPEENNIEKYKLLAVVGYIVPFLFFVPLITEGNTNKFARYHANQQLLLLLFWVLGHLVASLLTFVLIGVLLYPVIFIVGIIFMVMGVMNALKGEMKPLPVMGRYELIK